MPARKRAAHELSNNPSSIRSRKRRALLADSKRFWDDATNNDRSSCHNLYRRTYAKNPVFLDLPEEYRKALRKEQAQTQMLKRAIDGVDAASKMKAKGYDIPAGVPKTLKTSDLLAAAQKKSLTGRQYSIVLHLVSIWPTSKLRDRGMLRGRVRTRAAEISEYPVFTKAFIGEQDSVITAGFECCHLLK